MRNNIQTIFVPLVLALCFSVLAQPTPVLAVFDGGGGGGGGTAPTVTVTASPTSIALGGSSTITWSANKGTCTSSDITVSALTGSVSVSPTATQTYTVTCSNANGATPASATVTVTGSPDLTAGTPSLNTGTLTTGSTVTFTALASNVGAAGTATTFSNYFQIDLAANGTYDVTLTASSSVAGLAASASASVVSPAWVTQAGSHKIRMCADLPSNVVAESNEGNNCGADYTFTVGAASAATASISASPTSVTSGQSATLTWSSTSATSCTGTGFATGNQTAGSVSVSPTTSTSYSVLCTGTGGSGSATTTVSVASAPTSTSYAGKACTGGTYLGSYGDTINSCVSYCTGLGASCCTTSNTYGDSGNTYSCTAYSGTTATINAPTTGGCTQGGGGGGGTAESSDPLTASAVSVYKFLAINSNQPLLALVSGTSICNYTSNTATIITYGPAVTASLVTNPTSISAGQSAVLTWSSANATSCTGTGFATGNATSGSVTVTPTVTTTYTLNCTSGTGGSATDSKTLTVNVFTVMCSPAPNPVTLLQPVSWSSSVTGGTGSYTYSWTGSDSLSGATSSVSKMYSTVGEKTATLTVTSGSNTITTACSGTPCQTANCTCTGAGCGVVVQEGVSADVTAAQPVIATGGAFPGGTLTFSSLIQNIGNNSISSVFTNRFQVDIGADGTYDLNLDTGGSSGSQFQLQYGRACQTGTIVGTDSVQYYGATDLDTAVANVCQADAVAGQCCSAVVTTGTVPNGGGGGGGGGGNANLVERIGKQGLAALYKTLAVTYYNIDVTVYSNPTTSACPAGQSCYAGTWVPQSGTLYNIPYATSYLVTSPAWANIPGGTHKVRMCADGPTSQLPEANENNNCGPDYTFSVSGYDFTTGTPGVNSGTLTSGQPVTFFGTITNAPTSYAASGQCQATVVVQPSGSCSIAVSRDMIQWSTIGATVVSAIDPLTTSPTIPPTGANSIVITSPTEGGFFTSQAIKTDMMTNGGVSFPETSYINRTAAADKVTVDRACVDITGHADATAKAWGVRNYSSCGNNSVLKFNGTVWSNPHECSHLFSQLDCQYAGSPYTVTGTYFFPTPLTTGTHTYRLTDNATSNGTCQATITIPASTSGLCTLTPVPSIISSGGTSALYWTTTGASNFSIDQGIGTVTPVAAGSRNVTPTVTTVYTGTATTDVTIFNYTGTASNRFQIDLNNNGTWDTNLDVPNSLTNLNINQSKQVTSPSWTAVVGTHAVRLCADTPASSNEANPNNNCGPSFVFTVSAPTQCADGINNNSNPLIDTADPACTSAADPTEEDLPSSAMTLTANKATVKSGGTVTLTYSATNVNATSCSIKSSVGDNWTLPSASGTKVTNPITGETTYTFACTDLKNNATVSVKTTIKLAPFYQEI